MGAAAHPPSSSVAAPSVIAPGNHDGVHLGHRALLRSAAELARQKGLRSVALTFDPHPSAVLAPERAPTPLTTMSRRRELLLKAGADEVLVQPFTPELASSSPEQFLDGLMRRGATALAVGPDFRFGRGRAGSVDTLREYGARHGLIVLVEPPLLIDGERVSSSAIREAIARGEPERACTMLGRVHEIEGQVVEGYHRGRRLGFPTANLETDLVLHPADGVYAVVVRSLDREPHALRFGIANLGQRPTFSAGRSLEVHLLDWDGDLYGSRLRVGFVKRIRPEQKFLDSERLRQQIELDCQACRATLEASDRDAWALI
ncbi:MAG: bifunctional riboflavin kinase/FAD synthetase [Polyangiales bacterium]